MTGRPRLPLEPRLLSSDLAAAYCNVSVPTFEAECPVIPIRLRGRILYDRKAIDLWIDSLSPGLPKSQTIEERLRPLDDAHAH